jgi:peptidoglycan/LPS O-acetylase OafA/YrhL
LVGSGLAIVAILTGLVGKIAPWISAGFLSPAFAAVIFGLALRPRWAAVLELKWLVVLGEASYSLYLLHSTVLSRVYDGVPALPHWARVAFALGAALAAALLCYMYVERPGRDLLRPRAVHAALARQPGG